VDDLSAALPSWLPPEPSDPGYAAGAPQRPRLVLKRVVAAVGRLSICIAIRSPRLGFCGS
jgi:hypothetical protein